MVDVRKQYDDVETELGLAIAELKLLPVGSFTRLGLMDKLMQGFLHAPNAEAQISHVRAVKAEITAKLAYFNEFGEVQS